MPIFEFRCDSCNQVFEELVGVGYGSEAVCPACGHKERTRVPSRFAIAAIPTEKGDSTTAPGSCCGGNCGCR